MYRCRRFVQGDCLLPENECWFLHNKVGSTDEINVDKESATDIPKQDFHKAQEKAPPDQMEKILNLINQLSVQVQVLEKRTQIN